MKITDISTTAVTIPIEPPEKIRSLRESFAGKKGSRKPPTWLTPGIFPHGGVSRSDTRTFKDGLDHIDYVFVKI